MHIGLIGLGKMGGNMRTRMRNAGITVVGYDRDPELSDAASLEEMVGQLPSPKVVWVMVPAGDPPGRPSTRSAISSVRVTWWSTAATPGGPTTRSTPRCSPRRRSASSTAE